MTVLDESKHARVERWLITWLAIGFVSLAGWINVSTRSNQQFWHLANAFLHGSLSFISLPGSWLDTTVVQGQHYWPLGPLPALLLMPTVAAGNLLHIVINQGVIQIGITIGVLALVYHLARRFQFSATDSTYLTFAFSFASVYHIVAFISWSWYFAQAVTVLLLFIAINEHVGKKRPLIIGLAMAGALATRLSAGLAVIAFAVDEMTTIRPPEKRIRRLTVLLLPVIFSACLLDAYNYARFGNVRETGYENLAQWQTNAPQATVPRKILSTRYLPGNLYAYFIRVPVPAVDSQFTLSGDPILRPPYITARPHGVSLLVVTPILLYLVRARWRSREIIIAILGAITALMLPLLYYASATRIGPRYALDGLPFLWMILLACFPEARLPRSAKIVIMASAFFNLYLLTTIL